MRLTINEVGIADIIRELNTDALAYFTAIQLSEEWPSYENPLSGKFVRIGGVILLGATFDYGPTDYLNRRNSLKHIDMATYGCRYMGDELLNRIKDTAPKEGQYLKDWWPLVDAGHSRIRLNDSGRPKELVLNDKSFDYGRPDETTRRETGEIAQVALGNTIVVTAY